MVLTGKFIGFFRGNKTYISKWHLVDANVLFGIDTFGFLVEKLLITKTSSKLSFLNTDQ